MCNLANKSAMMLLYILILQQFLQLVSQFTVYVWKTRSHYNFSFSSKLPFVRIWEWLLKGKSKMILDDENNAKNWHSFWLQSTIFVKFRQNYLHTWLSWNKYQYFSSRDSLSWAYYKICKSATLNLVNNCSGHWI